MQVTVLSEIAERSMKMDEIQKYNLKYKQELEKNTEIEKGTTINVRGKRDKYKIEK